MGFYVTSPFKPTPRLLVQGKPEYTFGHFDDRIQPTIGWVQSDSAAATTATVVFQVTQGNIPVAGQLITIVGSANSAGIFNVTSVLILTVSSSSTVPGLVTVTFAISSTTQASTPDSGQVLIPQIEVGDTITTAPTSSMAVCSPVAPPNSVGKSLTVVVNLPASNSVVGSTLSGVTVTLQGANQDLDANYQTVATIATSVAAGSVTNWQSGQTAEPSEAAVNLINFRFYRLQVTAISGSGPIVGYFLQ